MRRLVWTLGQRQEHVAQVDLRELQADGGFDQNPARRQMDRHRHGAPQAILRVRKTTMGYVSQFLRVIPRVPTLDVVSEPLRAIGVEAEEAKDKARDLLTRLNVPEHLWHVAPATFSGGEQQRVNIARGFIFDYPILLLDEPTASLDEENQEAVLGLIFEARDRGTALVGIFHDPGVRKEIGSRHFEMPYSKVA